MELARWNWKDMVQDMGGQVRIGAGSGFWGDALDPAVELLERGDLDYMSMDYLAELTMALLQRQKLKDPRKGYIPDLPSHMRALLPLAKASGTRLVCNGGGANPRAAAERIRELARELGLDGMRIAVVEGDDLLGALDDLLGSGAVFENMDTGESNLAGIRNRIVAANAYTDSSAIQAALAEGADVVIAGRVSDNALYVGPIMHEFGWRYEDAYADRIAAAITIGHVVECAAATTGGMSSRFDEMPDMGRVGFPIVEFDADGTAVVTKLEGTGGRVDTFTVKEHLTYEIGDPKQYLMPDGIADFTTVRIEEVGKDRVRLSNMTGHPRPERLKLVIGYEDGWIGEGMLFFPWPHALERAEKARETLLQRFERLGLEADQMHFDLVGVDMLHGPASPRPDYDPSEVGLRVAVHTEDRDEAEKVRRACSQLWIMGPGGTSFGTPQKARPVFGLWPTLVSRDAVRQTIDILEA
ncbi:acyclic terpene utilization AtuA family protein [Amorphus sp. 3PC139-8]|uniref:acyclic terpene utilization AtuA family protein n=1 Tax=Amorphus sp. 3PC139-8 TaxID=2735676 RepID=UPI00345C9C91